ncbi:hypothetical protein NUU61_003079 [Penicillium alfredii]|uniref:Uncharacterized protein n=1 Tax=Penicillium alfredii TaxID=1506179 RepID=A0A9W9FSW4_9EURO|nr:uncharacterized protein NUU61_003079 [Penicillium alfredii]KAJ5105732.1 hypothetical protein NUU61_003079 [Penicillium alfredii]
MALLNTAPNMDSERRKRRKIQNRLNQRARRHRLKEEKPAHALSERHPYQVHRWRVEWEKPG